MYIYVHKHISMSMQSNRAYACMYVSYVCMCVCMYACMYVRMYV